MGVLVNVCVKVGVGVCVGDKTQLQVMNQFGVKFNTEVTLIKTSVDDKFLLNEKLPEPLPLTDG